MNELNVTKEMDKFERQLSDLEIKVKKFRKEYYVELDKEEKCYIMSCLSNIYDSMAKFNRFKILKENAPELFKCFVEYRAFLFELKQNVVLIVEKLKFHYNYDIVLEVKSIFNIIAKEAKKCNLSEVAEIIKFSYIQLELYSYIENHKSLEKYKGLFKSLKELQISIYENIDMSECIKNTMEALDKVDNVLISDIGFINAILDYIKFEIEM